MSCSTSDRGEALKAAWFCGMALRSIASTLHHRICHALGSIRQLPHSAVHAVMLPYVVSFNARVPQTIRDLSVALDAVRPAERLQGLGRKLGLASGLKALGMPRGDIAKVVERIDIGASRNPVPIEISDVRQLLEEAHAGSDVRG